MNILSAGCPLEGFQLDLLENWWFTKTFSYIISEILLHTTFLAKCSKSLFKSASLINKGVGINPNPLTKTLISILDKTLLEQK